MSNQSTGRHGETSDVDAHDTAMSSSIGLVVQQLVAILGASTVAAIGGVSETRAVAQWMSGREPQRQHVLRFALQLAMMVSSVENVDVTRAWFQGSNPYLNDQAPVMLLRTLPLEDIQVPLMAAARAFASR